MKWLTPERLNALEALVGLGLVVGSIGTYSVPAAAILLGTVLFVFAVWPSLWRGR
jgi:hypothetical protein